MASPQGSSPVIPEGGAKTPAVISYFKGPAGTNQTGLATFREVTYRNLWPGIDLTYSGTVNRLKYQFVVHPGADVTKIRLAYRGADVELNAAGQLEVSSPLGDFRDDKPYVFQQRGGRQVAIPAAYALERADTSEQIAYSFALGDYDPSLPLVIDPSVLIYAGYIGGTSFDTGNDVAVDAAGNAYVTGETAGTAGFPTAAGPDLTFNGATDAFVAKVNPAGTALVYAGYLGGDELDAGESIAVDASGNAYITGKTTSDATSFPTVTGPDLSFNGDSDAFVAKLNAAGTALLYAGYIGGDAVDGGNGIAVDADGNAYVTGETVSDEFSFPVLVGPDVTANGGLDGFVAKVNAAGTVLVFAGYVGGEATDSGHDIAVESEGEIFLTGETASGEATFPLTVGPDLTYNGGPTDAFVAKVRADGTVFDYAGYIGGELADAGNGIAVDADGQAHVVGNTRSTEATFPVSRGPDLTHNGVQDVFAAKVDAAGTALIYAGYIGGDSIDSGNAVALDEHGNAHVTGGTLSTEATFPVTGGDDRAVFSGVRDAYVAQINPAGSTLTYAGYLGGDADDRGQGIAIGPGGAVYIAGQTSSAEATFPVTVGPDLTFNGDRDAFIVKIEITGPSITLEGIVNAATFVGGPIAPGEIISIFGVDIGPDPGVNTTFDGEGNVPAEFAGVQVLINGIPAPLYFVGKNQINCQVPYEVDGAASVTVQVIFEGTASNIVTIDVAATAPGLFTLENGIGQVIAVLFPGGTLNSTENLVGPGDIVTLYGTGEGQTMPPGQTGVPVDANALPVPIAAARVLIGGVEQTILYIGGAPKFSGLLQINIELAVGTPEGPAVPIVVIIGGVGSVGALEAEAEGKAAKDDGVVTIATAADPSNQGPVANGQMVMTDEDTPVAMTLTGSDPEGDPLTFTITRNPTNGVLGALSPGGPASAGVSYTPVQDFNGADSFDFQVMDPNGGSSTATVEIEVKPLPDPPVANNDLATVVEETLTVIDVLRNDFDPDGDELIVSSVADPANGTTSTDGATVSYTPDAGFNAIESFDYTISDQNGKALDTATVTVRIVNAPPQQNQDPSANAQSVMTNENVPLPITLSGSDPDGDPLTFTTTLPPANGTLGAITSVGIETATVLYTPNTDYDGPDSFTFQVDDGQGGTATAVVSITVKRVSDLTITKTGPAMAALGGTATFDVMVFNAGPSDATGITVVDQLPPELTFSAGGSSASCSAAGSTVTCTPIDLAVGVGVTLSIEATVSGGVPLQMVTNTATVAFRDDPTAPDMASHTVELASLPPVIGDPNPGFETVGNTRLDVSIPPPPLTAEEEALAAVLPKAEAAPKAHSGVPSVDVAGNIQTIAGITDPESDPLTFSVSGANASAGTFTMTTPGGEFTYDPIAGCGLAPDTLTYTVSDGFNMVDGTLTINFVDCIWYVKNDHTPDGDATNNGTSVDPFMTLTEGETASSDGDDIFVFEGNSATTAYTNNVLVDNDQRLIGEGVELLARDPFTLPLSGPPGQSLFPAGNHPRIQKTGEDSVNVLALGSDRLGIEIRGLALLGVDFNGIRIISNPSSAEVLIANNQFGDATVGPEAFGISAGNNGSGSLTLAINNNTFVSVGDSTGDHGIIVDGSIGAGIGGSAFITSFSGNVFNGVSAGVGVMGTGVFMRTVTFDADPSDADFSGDTVPAGGTSIGVSGTPVGVSGMVLTNVSGDVNFGLPSGVLNVFATDIGLMASGTGTINAAAGTGFQMTVPDGSTVSGGGAALELDPMTGMFGVGAAPGGGVTVLGQNLILTDMAGTLIFSKDSALDNSSGLAAATFAVSGGNPDVTYSGDLDDSMTALIDIDGTTGGLIEFNDAGGSNHVYTATGVQGVDLTDVQGDVTLDAFRTDLTNVIADGLDVNGDTDGTLRFDDVVITDAGQRAILIFDGADQIGATIDFNNVDVTQTGAGGAPRIDGLDAAGNVDFDSASAIEATGFASGIRVDSNAGGAAIGFNGPVDMGTGPGARLSGSDGVSMTGNTGGGTPTTVSFADLDIFTMGADGIFGTGEGQLTTVTGTIDTIDGVAININGSGTGIDFTNTTLNFATIVVNNTNASEGIHLQNFTGTANLGVVDLTTNNGIALSLRDGGTVTTLPGSTIDAASDIAIDAGAVDFGTGSLHFNTVNSSSAPLPGVVFADTSGSANIMGGTITTSSSAVAVSSTFPTSSLELILHNTTLSGGSNDFFAFITAGSLCLSMAGNTLAGTGTDINLSETGGAISVIQGSKAILEAVNGGATVNELGTITYGAGCLTAPMAGDPFSTQPDAVDDPDGAALMVNEGAFIDINVLANDTDADIATEGDVISLISVTAPTAGGMAMIISPTTIRYTGAAPISMDTVDTFMYTITDKAGLMDTAQVTVTVNNVEPPMIATSPLNMETVGNTRLDLDDGLPLTPAPADAANETRALPARSRGGSRAASDAGTAAEPKFHGGIPAVQVTGTLTSLAGVTDSDSGFTFGFGAMAGSATGSSANSGTVTFTNQTTGEFTYDPPASCALASDSFTYVVSDGVADVNGMVSIALSGCIWYVDNSHTPNGDGTSADPFNKLSDGGGDSMPDDGEDASSDGEDIFVLEGDGTTTGQDSGITLNNDQRLLGEGVELTARNAFTLPAAAPPGPSLFPAGSNPLIGGGGGNDVQIFATAADRQGMEVRGLTMTGTGINGIEVLTGNTFDAEVLISNNQFGTATLQVDQSGIFADNVGSGTWTLAINDNSFVNVGQDGMNLTGPGFITSFSNNVMDGFSTGVGVTMDGVEMTNVTFDADPDPVAGPIDFDPVPAGGNAIGSSGTPVGANGMVLTTVSGNVDFGMASGVLNIFATTAGLTATGTGVFTTGPPDTGFQITVPAGSTIASGGATVMPLTEAPAAIAKGSFVSATPAVALDPLTAFFAVGATGGAGVTVVGGGLGLTDVAGTLIFSKDSDLDNPAGLANATFLVVGGSADVTYSGDLEDSMRALIQIEGTTGGTITFNDDGSSNHVYSATGFRGIFLDDVQGNVTLDAFRTDITSVTSEGIQILGNTDGTMRFDDVDIDDAGTEAIDISAGGDQIGGTIDFNNVDVTQTGVGQAVLVRGLESTGSVDFDSSSLIEATGAASGILVDSNAGGADIDFNGPVDMGTGTGTRLTGSAGVSMTANGGPGTPTTVSFADLDIFTSGQTGLFGTAAGMLGVTTGRVDALGATAIDVTGIDFSLTTANFTNVSSTGAGPGVVLTDTNGRVNILGGSIMTAMEAVDINLAGTSVMQVQIQGATLVNTGGTVELSADTSATANLCLSAAGNTLSTVGTNDIDLMQAGGSMLNVVQSDLSLANSPPPPIVMTAGTVGFGQACMFTAAGSAPVAAPDAAMVDEDTTVDIDVISGAFGGQDTDADLPNDTLTVDMITVPPGSGTATIISPTEVRYDYTGAFLGLGTSIMDPFTYKVTDTAGNTSTAVVTVTVNGVAVPPNTATDDDYETAGNTLLDVAAAPAASGTAKVDVTDTLCSNDTDGGGGLSIAQVNGISDNGPMDLDPAVGTIEVATAGLGRAKVTTATCELAYAPPADSGAAGNGAATTSDSFTYEVVNGTGAATVNIGFVNQVWYVDNSHTPDGIGTNNGTSPDPFASIATLVAAGAVVGANDTIFVYDGISSTTTTDYTGPVTIDDDGQRLIGEGVALTIPDTLTQQTVPVPGPQTLLAAGTHPQIDSLTNDVDVTPSGGIFGGIEVMGIHGIGSVHSINVSATGTDDVALLIANNIIGTTGVSASGPTMNGLNAVNTSSGNLEIAFDSNTVNTTGVNGVSINGSGATGATVVTSFEGNTLLGVTGSQGVTGTGVLMNTVIFDSNPSDANFTGDTVPAGGTTIGATGVPVGGAGLSLTTVSGDVDFGLASGVLNAFATTIGLQASGTGALNAAAGTGFGITVPTLSTITAGGVAVDLDPLTGGFGVGAAAGSGVTMTGTSASFLDVLGELNFASGSSLTGGGATNVFDVDYSAIANGIRIVDITYSGSLANTAGGTGLLVSVDELDATGSVTFDTGTLSASSGSAGISVNNTAGTVDFDGDVTVNTGTATGLSLTGNAGSTISFDNLDVDTTTGTGLIATGGGTVNVDSTGATSITSTTAPGIVANGVTFGATFDSVTGGTASATNGISLTTVSGTLTMSGGTIMNGTTGSAFLASGGCPTVTYAGSIVNSTADSVDIQNTGVNSQVCTFTFSGSINDTGTGISLLNNVDGAGESGTFTFSNASKTVNTGTNTAINLNNNDNATINFSGGGLDIDTTSGTGFNATGGGTVNASGANNTVTTTSGQAVDIDNMTTGITFTSIASTNATNHGVDLTNLGASSTFNGGTTTITNSGITATTNNGALRILTVATGSDIDFGTTNINTRNGTGIFIDSVTGGTVDFASATIANTNNQDGYAIRVEDSSAAVTFSTVDIDDTVIGTAQTPSGSTAPPTNAGDGDGIFLINNTGSVAVNGGTITNSAADAIDIRTTASFTVDGVTISGQGQDGIQLYNVTGTSSILNTAIQNVPSNQVGIEWWGDTTNGSTPVVTVSSSQIDGASPVVGNIGIKFETRNNNHNARLNVNDVGGAASDMIIEEFGGSAIVCTPGAASGGGTFTAVIEDLIARNAAAAVLGQTGLDFRLNGSADATIWIENLDMDNVMRGAGDSGAVNFITGVGASGTFTVTVKDSSIDNSNRQGIGSLLSGAGTTVSANFVIDNNDINDVGRHGIRIRADDDVSFTARITNNRVGNVSAVGDNQGGASDRDAMELRVRDNSGDSMTVLLDSNTFVGTPGTSGGDPGVDIDVEDGDTGNLTVTNNNFAIGVCT